MDWNDRELDEVVAQLRGIWERQPARSRAPVPSETSLVGDETPYERARREFARHEERLGALGDLGGLLIDELLPPPAEAGEEEELVGTLRALQESLFRHPLAFRAAFSGLVEEGRRFAATPEGADWAERLRASPLLPRFRLFAKMLSFSMLEQDEAERLPSAYLEGLFRLAEHPDADAVLDRLFGSGAHDG